MNNRKRRRCIHFVLHRLLPFLALLGIVAIVVPALKKTDSTSAWMISIGVVVVLYIMYCLFISTRERNKYFREITLAEFGDVPAYRRGGGISLVFRRNEENINRAVDGILSCDKVKPYYVHAAPAGTAIDTVMRQLDNPGVVVIAGGPGEGKSMLAFHAIYRLLKSRRFRKYHAYVFNVETSENVSALTTLETIKAELDSLPSGRSVILIDDSQKMAGKEALLKVFREEAAQNNGKYVWIETEYYRIIADESPDRYKVTITLAQDFEDLLRNFYQTKDPTLQKLLKGRIDGLDEAVGLYKAGKIQDKWHFAFVASRRAALMPDEIGKLSNVEMLVLFMISTHTVLSSHLDISRQSLLDRLHILPFGWLAEDVKTLPLNDAIKKLQEQTENRPSMIRVYGKSGTVPEKIGSLHYLFARTVIRTVMSKEHLVPDLRKAAQVFLVDDYRQCVYINVFLKEIKEQAPTFINDNADWFLAYASNPVIEFIQGYPWMMKYIETRAPQLYSTILDRLDAQRIADLLHGVSVTKYHALGDYLDTLGKRKLDVIDAMRIHMPAMAKRASQAEIEQFSQIGRFIIALPDAYSPHRSGIPSEDDRTVMPDSAINYRRLFIGSMDMDSLKKRVAETPIDAFHGLADLIYVLEPYDDNALDAETILALSETASSASVDQFDQVASLISALGMGSNCDHKKVFIDALDMCRLKERVRKATIFNFQGLANLLFTLGPAGDNMLDDDTVRALSQSASDASINQFTQVANLMYALKGRAGTFIDNLDFDQLQKRVNSITVREFDQLAQFIWALDPEFDGMPEDGRSRVFVDDTAATDTPVQSMGGKAKAFIEAMSLDGVIEAVKHVELRYLANVASLLGALESRREEILPMMDIDGLPRSLLEAPHLNLAAVTKLLPVLGTCKARFCERFEYALLAQKVYPADCTNHAAVQSIVSFVCALTKECADQFIKEFHWIELALALPYDFRPQVVTGGVVYGYILRRAELLDDRSDIEKLSDHLPRHKADIIRLIGKCNSSQYGPLARYLSNLNKINHAFALDILSNDVLRDRANHFKIYAHNRRVDKPAIGNIRPAGWLVNAFAEINAPGVRRFVSSAIVMRTIYLRIQKGGWDDQVDDFKFLIAACYRAAPYEWRHFGWNTLPYEQINKLEIEAVFTAVDAEGE